MANVAEILHILRAHRGELVHDYLAYKEHVCRQVYARTDAGMTEQLQELEKGWPEYANHNRMISRRSGMPEARAEQKTEARNVMRVSTREKKRKIAHMASVGPEPRNVPR